MLADPRPRPRKHLSSVSVIDLLEPIGSARPQELRVRHPSELASHNLYLTAPQKMCHACRVSSSRVSARESGRPRSPRALFKPPPRRQRRADPTLLIDDQKVGGPARLQPAETTAEQPPRTFRDRGRCLDRVEPERAEPHETVGQARGAAGENAAA